MSTPDTSETEKIPIVPNQPKTPVRTVRLSDEVWNKLKALAAEKGQTVSDVLRDLIDEHLGQRR